MQFDLGIETRRGGPVFKVVSDRGSGPSSLFSCLVDDERFVRTYILDGRPEPVEDSLCFQDLRWARMYRSFWESLHPGWSMSIWRGESDMLIDVPLVCGDISMFTPDEISSFWKASFDGFPSHPLFRSPPPPSTVLCDRVTLVSEIV